MGAGAIGPMTLRNRVVMPAMDQNTCDDGEITDTTIAHYEARARGGAGLLIPETPAGGGPGGAPPPPPPGPVAAPFWPGPARPGRGGAKNGGRRGGRGR